MIVSVVVILRVPWMTRGDEILSALDEIERSPGMTHEPLRQRALGDGRGGRQVAIGNGVEVGGLVDGG